MRQPPFRVKNCIPIYYSKCTGFNQVRFHSKRLKKRYTFIKKCDIIQMVWPVTVVITACFWDYAPRMAHRIDQLHTANLAHGADEKRTGRDGARVRLSACACAFASFLHLFRAEPAANRYLPFSIQINLFIEKSEIIWQKN